MVSAFRPFKRCLSGWETFVGIPICVKHIRDKSPPRPFWLSSGFRRMALVVACEVVADMIDARDSDKMIM